MLRATTKLEGPRWPMVKMCPPAITTVEKPSPKPVAFQANGGPSLGQSFNKPVSVQRSSRLGPRQVGQSAADAHRTFVVTRTRRSPEVFNDTPDFCIMKAIKFWREI